MAMVRRSASSGGAVDEPPKPERSKSLTGQALIDETLQASFPASDPPSWTLGPAAMKQPDPRAMNEQTGGDGRESTEGTESKSNAPAKAQPREVVVEGGATNFVQQVTVGKHRLVADEPTAAGGTDSGPGPYDLLLAALGACTAMTIGLYARRKQLPLEAVRVRLRHAKIHAADCENCETKEGKLDRIERDVELVGNLDDEQRARLLEIANKCPVHRSLKSEIEIATRLV